MKVAVGKAWPKGMLGMLVLMLAVEGLVSARSPGLTSHTALRARFAAEQAAKGVPGAEGVLILGDSVLTFGVDPETIAKGTGRPAYNLATPGNPSPLALGLLRKAIGAGATPSAVVIGYMSLSGGMNERISDLAEVLGPAEAFELAAVERDPELFGRLAMAWMLPSDRYRSTIRESARPILRPGLSRRPRANPGGGAARAFFRAWAAKNGGELRAKNHLANGLFNLDREKEAFAAPWPIHPGQVEYLRRIAALAGSRGIPVFWVIPPISPEARAARESLGHVAQQSRDIRAIFEAMPENLVLIDARKNEYTSSEFLDSCHLNDRGARRLSASLAPVLARYLAPRADVTTRWVDLSSPGIGPERSRLASGREPMPR